MPLPASWNLITVTATYTQRDGSPAIGRVVFVSPQIVVADGEIIVPRSVVGTLDELGALSVQLPSTNDPDIAPTGWTWLVVESVAGLSRDPFAIEVPFDSPGIDLADVAPVEHVVDLVDLANVWTASQTLQSSFDGGENDADSTSRLNLESHQRATLTNPFGEVIRAFLRRDNAKAMIAWYEDYTGQPEPRTVAWIGAHGQSNDGLTWHNHWSVEVPDETGQLQTVFEIPFALWDVVEGYGIAQADRYVRAVAKLIVSQAPLVVEGPEGTFRELNFLTGQRGDDTDRRWSIRANSAAESGSNAGSDLEIVRRTDDGSPIGDAVEIRRSDGRIFVGEDVRFKRNDRGPVLTDRTTGTGYRLFVNNGVLDIEPVP